MQGCTLDHCCRPTSPQKNLTLISTPKTSVNTDIYEPYNWRVTCPGGGGGGTRLIYGERGCAAEMGDCFQQKKKSLNMPPTLAEKKSLNMPPPPTFVILL